MAGGKVPVVRCNRRIADRATRALVVADARTVGPTQAARLWGTNRRTVYDMVQQANEDPSFEAMVSVAVADRQAALAQRSVDAQHTAVLALTVALQRPGLTIQDLLNATRELARINGLHKGDALTAASGVGKQGGPSIMLPVILTQPRVDAVSPEDTKADGVPHEGLTKRPSTDPPSEDENQGNPGTED
jgi:hypothetical protein